MALFTLLFLLLASEDVAARACTIASALGSLAPLEGAGFDGGGGCEVLRNAWLALQEIHYS